ncbi:MAG: tetratricopeptide repeat protein [Phycisphaerales bacterium]|nr:MAG: tetratricopeptide repeat protein [Phycisphaerales bacterium]
MRKVWPKFLSITIAVCGVARGQPPAAQPPGAEQPTAPQAVAQPAPEGPPLAPAALVREGNALFDQQAFEAALSKYDRAKQAVPDSAELAFNRGLTQYKLEQLDSAATALNQAVLSNDRQVEELSKYLLGNIQHNQALQVREQDPKGAIERLQQATRYYVDALELTPDNDELRANIELAQQLIELIREEQKQEQQQQQDQQQDQQEQEQQQQEQQSQEEQDQQQQQQQEEQQQSGEQNEQQDQEDSEQQQPQEQDQEQEQQEQQQQQGGQEGEQQNQQQQQQMSEQEAQELEQQISQEQAERMFQQIRDKERQRRLQKAQRERRESKPVKKDW